MNAWLAAIAALPKIIQMMTDVFVMFEKMFGPDWPKRMSTIVESYDKLGAAKTDEEKLKALSAIVSARYNKL